MCPEDRGRGGRVVDWTGGLLCCLSQLRKSGPFVTSGAFHLSWLKNMVINFYLTMEAMWGLWQNGSSNWPASWQHREKAWQVKGNKGCFPKNCWCEGQTEILSLIWQQTPAADGMELREEVCHLTNILFCTEQIASTGVLSVISTRLCHILAVGRDVYVSAKMLGMF